MHYLQVMHFFFSFFLPQIKRIKLILFDSNESIERNKFHRQKFRYD